MSSERSEDPRRVSEMDNYQISKDEYQHTHSEKVEALQPGAGGVFPKLPETSQLMKRTVREYKVPRWV